MRLLAYYRVSTSMQEDSGLGLEAQRASVHAHAAARGDEIVLEITEVASGGKDDRELLNEALAAMKRGEADGLIVSKLDRLARSVAMTAKVLNLAQKQGWKLIALDLGIDTSSPVGEMVANILGAVAQWERRQIGARTKEALAAKRERQGGKLKGNKPSASADTVEVIRRMREAGFTYRKVAQRLTDLGYSTPQSGCHWHASTVKYILDHA